MCAQALDKRDLSLDESLTSRMAAVTRAGVEPVDLSMVIPIFNEEGSIAELYETLTFVLASQGCTYELLFVDDGSRDSTFSQLHALHARDPRVRVIRFRRNFGKTAALA